MKRLLELVQQQDGALCALQLAIVFGFSAFWIMWVYLSIKNGEITDCLTGVATLLSAMLAAKVWKDMTDYKNQAPATTTTS